MRMQFSLFILLLFCKSFNSFYLNGFNLNTLSDIGIASSSLIFSKKIIEQKHNTNTLYCSIGMNKSTSSDSMESTDSISLNSFNYTRKIIHITAAPLFISTWQFYDSKFIASLVPICACIYLLKNKSNVNLLRYSQDEYGSKDPVSYSRGPFLYTLVLSFITLLFWKDNPLGIIAMTQLSFGDGFADIVGSNFGKFKIFPNNKSIEGTLAFILMSSIATKYILNIAYYNQNFSSFYHKFSDNEIFLISIFCGLGEVFLTGVNTKVDSNESDIYPLNKDISSKKDRKYFDIDDNIIIPLIAIIIGNFLIFNNLLKSALEIPNQ